MLEQGKTDDEIIKLSILYLRCQRAEERLDVRPEGSFNSLFEMPYLTSAERGALNIAAYLSILYLRCLQLQGRVVKVVVAGTFNSLFEMQSVQRCPFMLLLRLSFNSLFEMPQTGVAMSRLAAWWAFNSLFEMLAWSPGNALLRIIDFQFSI